MALRNKHIDSCVPKHRKILPIALTHKRSAAYKHVCCILFIHAVIYIYVYFSLLMFRCKYINLIALRLIHLYCQFNCSRCTYVKPFNILKNNIIKYIQIFNNKNVEK